LSSEIKSDLLRLTVSDKDADVTFYFCLAERMERVGDYDAKDFYEKAIDTAPHEPNLELFYAEYLRTFRGALGPLFPQAEEHYFAALEKVNRSKGVDPTSPDGCDKAMTDTERSIFRGLSALYQQDGVALFFWKSNESCGDRFVERPFAFLASINSAAQSDADLDRDADVRDYTSEALFANSNTRLNGNLTIGEVATLVRLKKPIEILDRIRLRYENWPMFDLFYSHRQTWKDQLTNFDCVTLTSSPQCSAIESTPFNGLRQSDFGFTVQKPFAVGGSFDATLIGTFRMTQRWGIVETSPGTRENIPQVDLKGGISRFVAPDKLNLEVNYTHQWIKTVAPDFPNRDRQFVGATATYQLFRPIRFGHPDSSYANRFETRGWDFFGGFLQDNESFINTTPSLSVFDTRRDFFVGTSLKGVDHGLFDFTVQPTWFTSSVAGDSSQRNVQYRTNADVLIRFVDEERNAGLTQHVSGLHLAFVHLLIPFRDDLAVQGPNWFENRKVGAELDSKFFTYSRWTTFLWSMHYDRVQFYHLGREVNAFTLNLSMGF
jgi:hypothetical protein